MQENKEYNPYNTDTQKTEYMDNMEKSAFAQYVTAGAMMHAEAPKRRMDIKEFRRTYNEDGYQKKIFIIAVIGYVVVALNVITAILFNIIGLVDSILLGGLVFGIHKNKSKGCAVGLLVYSIFNWLIAVFSSGNLFFGWVCLAIPILSLIMLHKADKAYKKIYG